MTCRISRFQDGGSFQLNPLVTTGRLKSSSSYERIKNKQVTVPCPIKRHENDIH